MPGPILTGWHHQIIVYLGDGEVGHLIETAFPLDVGITSITIFKAGPGTVNIGEQMPVYRHNPGMPDSAGNYPAVTNKILDFTADGFTVGSDGTVNDAGEQFVAVVLNDTTGDQHYLRVGHYFGVGGPFDPPRLIPHGGGDEWDPSAVWVHGRGATFRHSTGNSVALTGETQVPVNQIRDFVPEGFYVGHDNNVNDSGVVGGYFWTAVRFTGDEWMAKPAVPIGIPPINAHVEGIPDTAREEGFLWVDPDFRPAFVHVRSSEITALIAQYRGPIESHTGAQSSVVSNGGVTISDGIPQMIEGTGTIEFGPSGAPAAQEIVGWAWSRGYPIDGGGDPDPDPGGDPGGEDPHDPSDPGVDHPKPKPGEPGYPTDPGTVKQRGWWSSRESMNGAAAIIEHGTPANPRSFEEIKSFATGLAGAMGGSPGAAVSANRRLIYPVGGYAVGTVDPVIRLYDGLASRYLATVPPVTGGGKSRAVVSMLAANGTVYFSTLDSGTVADGNWSGRMFILDVGAGIASPVGPLGGTFPTGHLPYALAWHNGRVWVGTNRGNGTPGQLFSIAPTPDLMFPWIPDADLEEYGDPSGSILALQSFQGALFIGVDGIAGVPGRILRRDPDRSLSTVAVADSGVPVRNNGCYALTVFKGLIYAAFWNESSPVRYGWVIRSADGVTWETVLSTSGDADSPVRPFIAFFTDRDQLYVLGGGRFLSAALWRTSDGLTWIDLSANLVGGVSASPLVGVVVL